MTPKEFIVELGKTDRDWFRDAYSVRREIYNYACPITAVCKQVTGKHYSPIYWKDAAKLLGLDGVFARKVMLAADKSFLHSKKLRQEILVATGLKERE